MDAALTIFDRLLQIALLIQDDMARSFAGSALTPARSHLLWELHRLGPSTQQTLAAALQVSPRNVTGLVDAVQAAGFVRREAHPNDRRATLVTLTELGSRTTARMERDRAQSAAELVGDLSPEQVTQLEVSLASVADRLERLVKEADASTSRERRA